MIDKKMTTEERRDLYHAIDEFYDNAFHPSMKPKISDKAKTIALKCMLIVQEQTLDKTLRDRMNQFRDNITKETDHKLSLMTCAPKEIDYDKLESIWENVKKESKNKRTPKESWKHYIKLIKEFEEFKKKLYDQYRE